MWDSEYLEYQKLRATLTFLWRHIETVMWRHKERVRISWDIESSSHSDSPESHLEAIKTVQHFSFPLLPRTATLMVASVVHCTAWSVHVLFENCTWPGELPKRWLGSAEYWGWKILADKMFRVIVRVFPHRHIFFSFNAPLRTQSHRCTCCFLRAPTDRCIFWREGVVRYHWSGDWESAERRLLTAHWEATLFRAKLK